MKKMLPLILCLILLLSMSTTAFAAESTDTTDREQAVTASYEAGAASTTIISVDIAWENMSFTYKGASEPVWDASKHEYSESTQAGWEAGEASITITNHSNTVLKAGLTYEPDDGFSGISMHFTSAAPYIGSAHTSDTAAGTPCAVTVLAIPDGELPATTAADTRIGQITVEVEEAAAAEDVFSAIFTQIEAVGSTGTDTAQMARGTVYYESEAVMTDLYVLWEANSDVLQSAGASEAEKNAALNEVITAFYSALKIRQ